MAVTKTISIDGQEVTFRASAAIPRLYRVKFHRDIYRDLDALQKAMEGSNEGASTLDTFSLEDIHQAFDTFINRRDGAVKVVVHPND